MQFISSISTLASRYDAFILDLWGVVHDGQHLYPTAKECLENLHGAGKKIVFLSNAPRRAKAAADVLARMGILDTHYDAIVTSGETAYQCLAHPESSFFAPRGRQYFYIGLEKDRRLLADLHYEEAAEPESSQFLLLAHSYFDNQPLQELLPLLSRCVAQKLPALCINPDHEVVRQGGERVYCAGALAEQYHKMGGEVVYFGKPYPAVYALSLRVLEGIPKERIVAVGDNLATDIRGAREAGIASALVTGGILHETLGEPGAEGYEAGCKAMFAREGITPDYVVSVFKW